MLDRSIPFYNVILRCDHYRYRDVILPEGYSFASYKKGYEKAWARLEFSVGDFASETEAETYFAETYMQDEERLIKNVRFLLDRERNVVGTCIARKDTWKQKMVSSLHWLVVEKTHQKKGLGKALCAEVMNIFCEQDGFPVYVHTQPWSWKAIFLYVSLGFKIQRIDTFSHYENQYLQAMDTLQNRR